MFMPTPLTVKAGSNRDSGRNMDDEPHTVVSDTGLFVPVPWIRREASRQVRRARHVSLYVFDSSAQWSARSWCSESDEGPWGSARTFSAVYVYRLRGEDRCS